MMHRIWNKKKKKMYYFDMEDLLSSCWAHIDGSLDCIEPPRPEGEWWEILEILNTIHCVKMRSAGLKDKYLKEVKIFEGDIVRFFSREKKEDRIGKVVFNPLVCGFIITMKGTKRAWCYGGGIDEVKKVLGNIHEHPELMKDG